MMKPIPALVAVFLLFGPCISPAKAQSVALAAVNNNVATQLSGNGAFVLPNGWSLVNIQIFAAPTGNVAGQGGLGRCTPNLATGNWTGTITGLTTGSSYDVRVIMIAKDPAMNVRYFYSTSVLGIKVN
jgi:hypothetical protein